MLVAHKHTHTDRHNTHTHSRLVLTTARALTHPLVGTPRRSDIFPDVRAPRRPNYNYTPPDMHWLIAQQEAIQPGYEEWWIDELMRNRWRTLLSVDDLIEGVVGALDDTGVLDNTWIFFTSDHGQNLGH